MKVLVSVPNLMWIHKHVVFALMKLYSDKRHHIQIILPTHRPYENNLHHIIHQLLEDDYDYWVNIDADNPPIKSPLDLIDLDKDIVGLPTPIFHFDKTTAKRGERPIYWNGYKYVEEQDAYTEWEDKNGLQKVDAIGTGCFVIKADVFKKWDYDTYGPPFSRKLLRDGRVEKGNDISFCERARKQGFEIYMHYDYPCMHFHELELNEIAEGFINFYGVK